VIGRESGSAQVSWDDACTAIVPTLAWLEPVSEIKYGPSAGRNIKN